MKGLKYSSFWFVGVFTNKEDYAMIIKKKNKRGFSMLARLELKLKSEEPFVYQMSSLFHGALMELLPEDYADALHESRLHPYAQHLEYRDGDWYWVVNCLNKEAAKIIIHDTLWNLEHIKINNRDMDVAIVQKRYAETSYKELMNQFYEAECERYLQVHFISPTAFKQNGRYLFYPEFRCFFQSLMNKYDSSCREESMIDADTLEQLYTNAQIVRYDLKSVSFSLEGVKIPSFIGKITIKMNGTQTMANFARMLLEFGTYSGVGIKTSLGMGCMRLIKEKGSNGKKNAVKASS